MSASSRGSPSFTSFVRSFVRRPTARARRSPTPSLSRDVPRSAASIRAHASRIIHHSRHPSSRPGGRSPPRARADGRSLASSRVVCGDFTHCVDRHRPRARGRDTPARVLNRPVVTRDRVPPPLGSKRRRRPRAPSRRTLRRARDDGFRERERVRARRARLGWRDHLFFRARGGGEDGGRARRRDGTRARSIAVIRAVGPAAG